MTTQTGTHLSYHCKAHIFDHRSLESASKFSARGIPADNLYTGQSCSPIIKDPRSMDPCDPFTPTSESSPGPSLQVSVGFLVLICDFALFGQMVLCLSASARTVTVLSLLGQLFALASSIWNPVHLVQGST